MNILSERTGSGNLIRASGIRYNHKGSTAMVHARKEVILAVSGIGDARLLGDRGIDFILDLPAVGENLQDHAVGSICFEATDAVDTLDALIRQETDVVAQAIDLAYFEIIEKALLDPNEPTAAYLVVSAQMPQSAGWLDGSSRGPLPGKFLAIGAMLSHTLSRGTAHIQSNDYSTPPVIDPKYLSNPIGMEVLAQHMLEIEKIARAPSFSKLLKQPLSHGDPASRSTNTEEAKQYLRGKTISMWHLGSTCVMLPKTKGGVIGANLKFAFPTISTAYFQATVYAFAERASQIIKAGWVGWSLRN
ncbi:hypothetical protein F4777DRAFT_599654 [Nemania sp. FL0916]|nr:hypothetical protein F4777DRAFT_599654 [Nemania sp. FL0916]